MAEARRCTAKAERTHGHVRFALDVVDDKVLDQLIALKRAQYEATGTRDYFGEQRRIELMHRLLHTRGSGFSGTLSTLHFGDHLAAAHFGIRSDHVLHWWFPVFERAYAKLSPGWILLREVIAAAPELGIDRIDLGWGDDDYKRRVQTGEVVVSRAVLTHSKTRRAVHHARHAIVEAVKNSPLGPRLSEATRILRGIKR
jgi:CelD/BcsL family acetyltransferase involved in cellulose biosynthesis